jgi:hypothetical protein
VEWRGESGGFQKKDDQESEDKEQEKEEDEFLSERRQTKSGGVGMIFRGKAFGPEGRSGGRLGGEGGTYMITNSLDPVSMMTGIPSWRGVPIPIVVMYWIPIISCRETSESEEVIPSAEGNFVSEKEGEVVRSRESLSLFQVLRFCFCKTLLIEREAIEEED